jgi:hypothetical protein
MQVKLKVYKDGENILRETCKHADEVRQFDQ